MTDEAFVRANWERVIVCDGSYRHYSKGTVLLNWANHCFHEFVDFGVAAQFTRTRLEEIRQVEEDIDWVAWKNAPIGNRIAERLRDTLAELTRGMIRPAGS